MENKTTEAPKKKILKEELLVKDIMSTDLFTLYESDSVRVLDEMMKWRAVRHIPVVNDNNQVVGLVTHRDLLKLSFSSFSDIDEDVQNAINEKIPITKIMKSNVATISPNTSMKDAAQTMYKNKFGCLPVIDENDRNRLVGIITEADFVKFFVEWEVFTF